MYTIQEMSNQLGSGSEKNESKKFVPEWNVKPEIRIYISDLLSNV